MNNQNKQQNQYQNKRQQGAENTKEQCTKSQNQK